MSDLEDTIEYKGLTIEIHQDLDENSPDDWGNTDLFLVGLDRSEFWVERDGFGLEVCRALRGVEGVEDHYKERAKEIEKEYHVFGLEAYIHGGIALYLTGGCMIDRQWDVSQIGCVFAEKKSWRLRKSAAKAAQGLIDTWNQNLCGDVHGYIIRDADGEHLESCWGFYGMDDCIAEAKSVADHLAKTIQNKRETKLKAQILNKVPLSKRVR